MQTELPPTSLHEVKPEPHVRSGGGQVGQGGDLGGVILSTQPPRPANASSTIFLTLSGQSGQFRILSLIFPPSVPSTSTLNLVASQAVFESRRSSTKSFSFLLVRPEQLIVVSTTGVSLSLLASMLASVMVPQMAAASTIALTHWA